MGNPGGVESGSPARRTTIKRWPGAYVIGLTGNVATGKSAVMELLRQLGAITIDADRVVHDLLRFGTGVYAAVVREFGPEILRPDGEIDRGKLGAIVFRDPQALRRLERLTHPAVGPALDQRVAEAIRGIKQPVIVIEAIKLIESGLADQCDALWVVTAPLEHQVQRMVRNRGLSEAEARVRIQAQPPQAEKAALADVVIDNRGSLDDLAARVEAAWNEDRRKQDVSD